MTRSKIQKLKFFIFLLIFLLAQTAVCDGIFREKRNASSTNVDGKVVPIDNVETNEKLGDKDSQRNAAGSPVDAKKSAADDKTHDITSKPSDVAVVNKTAHTGDTSSEVRILR